MDVTGDGSKVQCYKEQHCIGTWNVRSINQGKLEMVKQQMERVNIDILGISELKWTGMGEFNSDDHYIYHCGQESLRRNGVAIIVNGRVQSTVLGCNLRNNRMTSVCFQGKSFNSTINQVYAPTSKAEEAEAEQFYEDQQDLRELTPKKDVLFITGDWNAKVGSQETPEVTGKFGLGVQNEAEQRPTRVLQRACTGHSKHLLSTTQEKTLRSPKCKKYIEEHTLGSYHTFMAGCVDRVGMRGTGVRKGGDVSMIKTQAAMQGITSRKECYVCMYVSMCVQVCTHQCMHMHASRDS